MHIGCCERCRYLDLLENVNMVCPRCSGPIVSLGITTETWNRMPEPDRQAFIKRKLSGAPATWPMPEEKPKEENNKQEEQQPDKGYSTPDEKVYVCYKCNAIAGHNDDHDRYYCYECGSDMIEIGMTTKEWAQLSKEEKRQAIEDAKIRHMVTDIKKVSFDDDETLPNVINVVGAAEQQYV